MTYKAISKFADDPERDSEIVCNDLDELEEIIGRTFTDFVIFQKDNCNQGKITIKRFDRFLDELTVEWDFNEANEINTHGDATK